MKAQFQQLATACRHFVRTSEAVDSAPSVRGLIRHVEATIQLRQWFVKSGEGLAEDLAFAMCRRALVAAVTLRLMAGRILRVGNA